MRTLLDEPRAPHPPRIGPWGHAFLVLVAALGIAGALFEPDITWRIVAAPLAVFIVLTLLLRRTQPFVAVLLGFGAQAGVDLAKLTFGEDTTTVGAVLVSGLVLTYSLCRWGSGREVAGGMAVVLSAHALSEMGRVDATLLESTVGSTLWLFPAAVGVVMRYRASLRDRLIEEARVNERQALARELHDTVAHHVSAIAVQAQAARSVAAARPEAASEILQAIEDEASTTLVEMRHMVGVLREPAADGVREPQAGLAQIPALTSQRPGGPPVDLEMTGDLDNLGPAVQTSLYRLTQEAITNARRHARHATRIRVQIDGDADAVRLSVADDGDPPSPSSARSSGFGLVGMNERALLLGGTLDAQPGPDRGWIVNAVLPRTGSAS